MWWHFPRFYFQMEIDEGGDIHEDSRERLERIRGSIGQNSRGMVLRINPKGMLRKKQHRDGEYKYSSTAMFTEKLKEMTSWIRSNILSVIGDDAMGLPERLTHESLVVDKLFFTSKPGI